MKTPTINDDFDTLNLYVKKIRSNEIVNYYKTFGWSLKDQKENDRYEDIFDLTFVRPHKINNKDELQLMQVYLEDKLNAMGKLQRNKIPKTTSFGLIFGVFGLIFLILGILFATKLISGLNIVASIIMMISGIVFLILTLIFIPVLYKKEILKFDISYSNLENEVSEICKKASSLLGGADIE